jgi:hypothetical protein
MSDEVKDDRGQYVCQKCGKNVARIHTLHRRSEADSRISYSGGKASFTRLPNDGDIVSYRVDEFLCFTCCYATLEPGEIDEAAQLRQQFSPEDLEPREIAEYQLPHGEAITVVQAQAAAQHPRHASAPVVFTSPRMPRRPTKRTPAGFSWGA